MHQFKDSQGRAWEIVIDVAAAKRVKGLVGIDLYKLIDEGAKGLGELLTNPISLVDVLYSLCKSQADKRGLTDEDFGAGFSGDSILEAANAFTEELIDFFPQPKARAALRKMIQTGQKVTEAVMVQSEARMEKDLADLDIDLLARKFIDSFTSPPASSASTQAP